MEITILELITKYGLNTLIIASLIFILTGLIKKPIKILAKKMNDGTTLTKYITFLPIILGFALTILYLYLVKKQVIFDGNFFTLWLTSSSLSLAVYAIFEKFIPNKNKLMTKNEIKQNEELLEKIQQVINEPKEEIDKNMVIKTEEQPMVIKTEEQPMVIKTEEQPMVIQTEEIPKQKIILRGGINVGTKEK